MKNIRVLSRFHRPNRGLGAQRANLIDRVLIDQLPQLAAMVKRESFLIGILVLALAVRLWQITMRVDYYGDSYHHWLMSYMTSGNNYVYRDFKPKMTLVWLPFYHYLTAFLMNVSGIYDLTVPHAINIASGMLTCVLVNRIMTRIYNRKVGAAAALALALQPWFVDMNTLGLTETLSSLLIISATCWYLERRTTAFTFSIALSMLTRYDGWIFAAIFLVIILAERKLRPKELFFYLATCCGIVTAWCLWSYSNSGDPFAWYRLQNIMTGWDVEYFFRSQVSSLSRLLELQYLAFRITFGFFPMGIAAGLLTRERNVKTVAILEVAYVAFICFQVGYGRALPESKYLIYILPFTAMLSASLFHRIHVGTFMRKAFYLICLLLVVVVPFGDTWLFQYKAYVVKPEAQIGMALRQLYFNGTIVSDSPTVIYYSGLAPKLFLSTDEITLKDSLLRNWLVQNRVRYLVWHNASYSKTWFLFRELSSGGNCSVEGVDYSLEYAAIYKFKDRLVMMYVYRISIAQEYWSAVWPC